LIYYILIGLIIAPTKTAVHNIPTFIINELKNKMNNKPQKANELDILTRAVQVLKFETGIQIEIQQTEVRMQVTDNQPADALLAIGPDNKEVFVEIKRHAQHLNIGAIISTVQRLPGSAMLVADYINPNMAEKLKQENIQFIDSVGNAWIDLAPVYIYITGKKQYKENTIDTRTHTSRAFEPKGLMVTYAFLTNPKLLNYPYRDIAAATNVALGTVGWVLNALKAGGYIHEGVRPKHRQITDYQKLLDRWVEAWPEKLKPKQLIGNFTADDTNWWQSINIQDYGGYWGGEIAGALYTSYLKPEIATIYIPRGKQSELIRDVRLKKSDEQNYHAGNKVQLYTPFWPVPVNQAQVEHTRPDLVNPVLAYADLIATADARNIETARRLYNEQIARHYAEA